MCVAATSAMVRYSDSRTIGNVARASIQPEALPSSAKLREWSNTLGGCSGLYESDL
jgi:hypothetical protein